MYEYWCIKKSKWQPTTGKVVVTVFMRGLSRGIAMLTARELNLSHELNTFYDAQDQDDYPYDDHDLDREYQYEEP